MPDVTVTFGAVDAGLGTAVANIKREIQSVAYQQAQAGGLWQGAPRTDYPSAVGGLNQLAKAQNDAAQAAQNHGSMFERMVERMAVRLTVLFALKEAIKAVGDFYKTTTEAQSEFVYWQNINVLNTVEATRSFDALKKAAHDSNQELQFIVGSSTTLREFGVAERDVAEVSKDLGKILENTGVDLTDIRAKAELGTAGTQDFLKASLALGEAFKQQAQNYALAEAKERSWMQTMQTGHTEMERSRQDAERAREVHGSFAEKLGATQAAWQAFQPSAGRIWSQIQMPPDLDPLLRTSWQKRVAEVQGQFRSGMQQIAKEQEITPFAVQRMVMAGKFSPEELIAANKRRLEEEKISDERGYQDQITGHQINRENTRIDLNEQIKQGVAAAGQGQGVMAQGADTVAGKVKALRLEYRDIQRTMGDIIGSQVGLAAGGKPVTDIQKFTQQVVAPQLSALLGIPPQWLGAKPPEKIGAPGTEPGTQPATESTLKQVADVLTKLPLLFTIGVSP